MKPILLAILILTTAGCGAARQGNEDTGGATIPPTSTEVADTSPAEPAPGARRCYYDANPDGTARGGWTNCTQDEIDAANANAAAEAEAQDRAQAEAGPEDAADEPDAAYVLNTMATVTVDQTWESMLPEAKTLLLEHAMLTRHKKCVAESDKRTVDRYELARWGDDAWDFYFAVEIVDGLVMAVYDGVAKTSDHLDYFDPRIMCPVADSEAAP